MAEYQLDHGGWVCSSGGTWMDGCYETQRACRIAYRKRPEYISKLWKSKRGPDGIIPQEVNLTEEELRKLPDAWKVLPSCVTCGGHVDTSEQDDGGSPHGCELSEGRWACSENCYYEEVK
jgi:hypothetical protein